MKFTGHIALLITEPTALLYSEDIARSDIIKISIKKLPEKNIASDKKIISVNGDYINSVVIFTSLSDKPPDLRKIHELAAYANILITTIVFDKKQCEPKKKLGSLADLREFSDMLIYTSDNSYLEYFLDCIS